MISLHKAELFKEIGTLKSKAKTNSEDKRFLGHESINFTKEDLIKRRTSEATEGKGI